MMIIKNQKEYLISKIFLRRLKEPKQQKAETLRQVEETTSTQKLSDEYSKGQIIDIHV